jgi:uncharacterized protein
MQARLTVTRGRAAPHAALFALLVSFLLLSVGVGLADMRRDKLTLVTATGEHTFEIEIADTPEEKARGLMFRRSLADNAGMLFPYGPPAQEATMWMRNTYISLDMVFIRADGVVHRIEHGTEPFSERVISSEGPVSAVLELKAGIASRIGLKAGDRAIHASFKAPPAKR